MKWVRIVLVLSVFIASMFIVQKVNAATSCTCGSDSYCGANNTVWTCDQVAPASCEWSNSDCTYYCTNGACWEPPGGVICTCIPGDTRCAGDDVETCDADCEGWSVTESCGDGCESGDCNDCSAGETDNQCVSSTEWDRSCNAGATPNAWGSWENERYCSFGCDGDTCRESAYCEDFYCGCEDDATATRMQCWRDSTKQEYINSPCIHDGMCDVGGGNCEVDFPCPVDTSCGAGGLGVCNNADKCCTGSCSPIDVDCGGSANCPIPAGSSNTQPTIDNCGGLNCVDPNSITCGEGNGEGPPCPTCDPADPECTCTYPEQVPTPLSPDDGEIIDDKQVTLTWDTVSVWGETCGSTLTNDYRLCITDTLGSCNQVDATLTDTTSSYLFAPTPSGNINTQEYIWSVRAINACGKQMSSSPQTFTLIFRPDLCSNTAIAPLIGDNGEGKIKITSTADGTNTISKFSLTFYNFGNLYDPPPADNPKSYCTDTSNCSTIAGESGNYGCTSLVNCPQDPISGFSSGSYAYVYDNTEVTQTHDFIINLEELMWTDFSEGAGLLPPNKFQVHGYFTDNKGRFSQVNGSCVERFGKIIGSAIKDDDNNCVSDGSLTINTINANSYSATGGVSDYKLLAPLGDRSVTMDVADDNYICSPGCGSCPTQTVTVGDGNEYDFYYTYVSDPWYQVVGGNILAGATNGSGSISDPLPDAGFYASLKELTDGTDNTSGYPIVGSSSNTVTAGGGTFGVEHLSEKSFVGTVGQKENFAYFKRLYSMPASPGDDFSDSDISDSDLDGTPANADREAFYTNGATTINTNNITISSSQSVVVFVNGNLTINKNITVAPGGFLAFIVSGDITIGSDVGETDPTSTTADVQGVYIANGQIIIDSADPTPDKKFVGAGTFVGWGGFSLARNYQGLDNNDYPVELFIYRPDFMLNAPEKMKKPIYDWFEIAP